MLNSIKSALLAQGASPEKYQGADLKQDFKYWQIRIMFGLMWGYALFYLVRKNFSMAMPGIEKEYGFSNTELGWFLTTHSLLYGVGKFLNGVLADRANPRWFMFIGLMLSALINFAFGFSSSYYVFGFLWMMNGWIQSMGWPPCARLLTTWYESKNLSTWWGLWNASHQIGGAVIFVLGGYLASTYGWRYVFWVPAMIALIGGLALIWALRDHPESIGFPKPDEVYGDLTHPDTHSKEAHPNTHSKETHPDTHSKETIKDQLSKYLINNPLIWFVSLGNCFVYIVRIGMLDWAPKMLKSYQNVDLTQAGWLVATLEVAGIGGGLLAGFLADRAFKGKGSSVNAIFMGLLSIVLLCLYLYPLNGVISYALALSLIGFLVYGPQMLTSVCAAQYAPKHCAGAATGFNGLFGYLGASITGVGTGYCLDHWGWNGGILFYLGSAIIGFILFLTSALYERQSR
jgi:phosphoglycerate transporter family protein